MTPTPEQLREYDAKATPAPWKCKRFTDDLTTINVEMTHDDWELCCALRNALPALIAAAERDLRRPIVGTSLDGVVIRAGDPVWVVVQGEVLRISIRDSEEKTASECYSTEEAANAAR